MWGVSVLFAERCSTLYLSIYQDVTYVGRVCTVCRTLQYTISIYLSRCNVCGACLYGVRNVAVHYIYLSRCNVCGACLYGVRNVAVHYNGKKHKGRLETEGWTTFDPVKEPPKSKQQGTHKNRGVDPVSGSGALGTDL